MAFVLGQAFDLNVITGHITNQERVVLVNKTANAAPLIQQQNTIGPTITTFGTYFAGQYSSNFEIRGSNTGTLVQLNPTESRFTLTKNVLCSSNLTVLKHLSAPTANITDVTVSNATASNIVVNANPTASTDLLKINLNPTTPILNISNTQGIFYAENGNFKLGIGTTQPLHQLHVRSNVMIEGELYNKGGIRTPLIMSASNTSNSIEFTPNSNVITGNTTFTGDMFVQGIFKLQQRQDFSDVRVTCNLNVMHIHVSNLDSPYFPSIRVDHIIPTYGVSNMISLSNVNPSTGAVTVTNTLSIVQTTCNTEAIIDIDVDIPNLDISYRALTMDSYGRVGMGTSAPEYFLSLEASEYNQDYIGKGLIYAKSSLANDNNMVCDDVFVVDRYARVGIGTAVPAHFLHVNVCHHDEHSSAILAIHKNECHECPFFEFSCNETPIAIMDRDGALIIGTGMSNKVADFGALHNTSNFYLAFTGDAYAEGTVYTSGLAPAGFDGSNIIDVHSAYLSNVGSIGASNIMTDNLLVNNITAALLKTENLVIPGLDISSTALATNLSVFAFTGKAAVFNVNNDTTLPVPLTAQSIYTNANQGKVQIVAPNSEFVSLANAKFTNLLKLEGPAPALVLRNTLDEDNDGKSSSATILFNFDKSVSSTISGALKFSNGTFYLSHQTANVIATQSDRLNMLNGAFGVYKSTDAVSFFNFENDIDDVAIASKLRITRGVQINGNLYMGPITTSVTPYKLTVNGNAEMTGTTTLSNVNVLGQLSARNSVLQWSDSNLKTDILPIENALEKVCSMNGCSFLLKDAPAMREVGLIAQEVALVVPEVVREGENGNLAVAYGNLAGVFVEAIKELTNKVNSLQAIIASMQASSSSS